VLTLTLVILIAAAPVPEDNPDTRILFGEDADYRAAVAIESRYEGTLEFLPVPGGPGRFRFIVPEGEGKIQTHELLVPRRTADLGAFVGQSVRITGKLTDKGLWPGKIERRQVVGNPGRDGILARTPWQPAAARKISRPAQTFLVRSGEQAAALLPLRGTTPAAAATELLARELRVPEIDWTRQMVVCVSVGLRTDVESLIIRRIVVRDDVLHVIYQLKRVPAGMSAGFGYPAETVLIPRFDGTIRFEEEP